MPRRTFKTIVRLAVPERAGDLTLSAEAREFIRDALKEEAAALVRDENLLWLHEKYLSHERKRAAEARRKVQAAKKPAKESVETEATAASSGEKNVPSEESSKAVSQNIAGDLDPIGTEHSEPGEKAASIDLPPGNQPDLVLEKSTDTPSKQPQ